ncbi:hypothetical protein BBJ28_00009686 [Nothophytophthora sp. Chile5]|nr:hypothetical protein BBJ28_00009686 [Nothophytophthora sp. Chile5]
MADVCLFLEWSQLLRFDDNKRQVIVGLIDYLHQFDFLKKMESTSKASLTFRNPTVISPISYRRRFMNAMNRYFVGIAKDLELRMRKRGGSKAKPLLLHSPAVSVGGSTITAASSATPSNSSFVPRGRGDEQKHADEAARLASNMAVTSESPLLGQKPPAKSEYQLPKLETEWTSMKPRGHSMSHMSSDHEANCDRVVHSEGECHSSPCSSSSGSSVKSFSASFSCPDVISEQHSV